MSAIKFRKRHTKFKITIALPKKFSSKGFITVVKTKSKHGSHKLQTQNILTQNIMSHISLRTYKLLNVPLLSVLLKLHPLISEYFKSKILL